VRSKNHDVVALCGDRYSGQNIQIFILLK